MTDIKGTAALTPGSTDSDALREAEAARLKALHDREFAEFAESSYYRVERILRATCRDRQAVDDALQEAYLHGRVEGPSFASTSNRPAGSSARPASRC
ncbi:hypothetical protein V2I01_15405 [Micromonospora sp. BRA006-A]|nr:hypothetical protein [Micromonospora sp. BRA006-A]